MGPIFNEKVAAKYNLWVREQCTGPTCGWKLVEKSNFSAKKKKSEKHKHASRKCVTYPKALILYEEEKENKEDDIEEVYEPNMAEINVRDD